MRWLAGLLQRVERVTELRDSDKEIEGEVMTVVGKLPENIKKLYSYCDALNARIREITKEADETDSKSTARELRRTIRRLRGENIIAAGIMWQETRFEFKEQIKPDDSLFICKGFTLCSQPVGEGFPSFLREILDGEVE